jgi:hypothetical protein
MIKRCVLGPKALVYHIARSILAFAVPKSKTAVDASLQSSLVSPPKSGGP